MESKDIYRDNIEYSAIVSPYAKIHDTAVIHAHAVIEANVEVGEHSTIGPNTYLAEGTKVGKYCHIGAGVCIGGPGFSYGTIKTRGKEIGDEEWRDMGFHLARLPSPFSVIIEDFVDINANCVIDKGTKRHTIISTGSKLCSLVHIGHDVQVGKSTWFGASCMVAGHVTIGDQCKIRPSTMFRPRVTVGDNVTTGVGALVVKDIPAGETWAGNPAEEFGQYKARRKISTDFLELRETLEGK